MTKIATLKLERPKNSKWPKRKQSKIPMMNLENPQDRDLQLNVPDHDLGQDLHLQQNLKVVLMLAAAKNRVVEAIPINTFFFQG